MLAGVVAAVAARRAVTAVGVGIDSDGHARAKMLGNCTADLDYLGADFVSGDDGHLDHRIEAAIGVQVAAAESDVMNFQQHLVCSALGFLHVYNLHHRRFCNL